MKDYYGILGVNKDARTDEIKRAYFKLIRKYPPEKNPEEYKNIREAYDLLRDETKRAKYNSQRQYGNELEEYNLKAEEAMANDDYKLAIREYKKILVIEPSFEEIKNRLGLALMYDGQINEALKQFKSLVE